MRHLNPFFFAGLLPLLCSTQGGDPGQFQPAGGGTPPAPAATPTAGGAPPAANAPPAGGAGGTPGQGQPPPAGGDQGRNDAGQFQPAWLNDRIKQARESERRELLSTLGVTDPEAAKKLLEEGKKAVDATKSELQRKDEENKTLKAQADKATEYEKGLKTRADAAMAKLSPEAQAKVTAVAGADPLKVLDTIDLLTTLGPPPAAGAQAGGTPGTTPNGQQGQGQPAPAAPGQGKPPVQPAASTTAALGGPPSANGSPPDHLAIWQDMVSKNPLAASHYYLANQRAIVEAQQQKNK